MSPPENSQTEDRRAPRLTSTLVFSLLTVALSVGGSVMTFSRAMGKAETTIKLLVGEAKEADKRARADHDLIIQIAADLRYIRALATTPKGPPKQ